MHICKMLVKRLACKVRTLFLHLASFTISIIIPILIPFPIESQPDKSTHKLAEYAFQFQFIQIYSHLQRMRHYL